TVSYSSLSSFSSDKLAALLARFLPQRVLRLNSSAAMSLSRRIFLKHTGSVSLAALGSTALPSATRAVIDNTEPMKITRIDAVTFRKDLHIGGGSGSTEDGAEFWWVQLHTDKGIIGMGETYPYAQAEIGALKEHARVILGRDPRDIDGIWRALHFEGSMRTTGGADMRVLSAV